MPQGASQHQRTQLKLHALSVGKVYSKTSRCRSRAACLRSSCENAPIQVQAIRHKRICSVLRFTKALHVPRPVLSCVKGMRCHASLGIVGMTVQKFAGCDCLLPRSICMHACLTWLPHDYPPPPPHKLVATATNILMANLTLVIRVALGSVPLPKPPSVLF